MPKYDYQCNSCKEIIEVIHRMFEDGPIKCEKCGKEGGMRKLLGNWASLQFKGSGFYETDYKKSSITETSTKSDGVEMGNKTFADGGVKRKD